MPVPVVFFRIPVASPDSKVPLIFTTMTAPDPEVVASPERSPTAIAVPPAPNSNCPLVRDDALVVQVGQAIVPVVVIGPPVIGPVVAMFVTVPVPPPIEAQPVALPEGSIPVGANPVEQSVGVPANAVAVAALPVVFWLSVGMSPATIALNAGAPAVANRACVVAVSPDMVDGADPAPPPITTALAPSAPEEAHVFAVEK